MFHLFPADGKNNQVRWNNPLGRVDRAQVEYKTNNGALSGACQDLNNAVCFEPADQYKGTLARAYLYMTVAYRNAFTCCDKAAVNGARIKPWALRTLLEWHARFPVSQYERERNEVVFSKYQHNRNPFIDHPELAQRIWPAVAIKTPSDDS